MRKRQPLIYGSEEIKDVDKGGAVVIMNSNFYEEYIFKMLSNTDDDKEIPNNEIGISTFK